MDPKDALRILIKRSSMSEEDRERMLAAVNDLSDAEVVELGTALAKQRRTDIQTAAHVVAAADAVLEANPNT